MLILLSPSKTLAAAPAAPSASCTTPEFAEKTKELAAILRRMTPMEIRQLMGVSEKIARLNAERYRDFSWPPAGKNAHAALLMFKGDVYTPMHAETYTADDLAYAQKHLRILSGLYGLLRPLDRILPYRLEMGTKLKTKRGGDLYAFWGDAIARAAAAAAREANAACILNLASEEYFKAVPTEPLTLPVVTVRFKEKRGDEIKTIGLLAKRARGEMADWILRGRITRPEALRDFRRSGYRFAPEMSDMGTFCFIRKEGVEGERPSRRSA